MSCIANQGAVVGNFAGRLGRGSCSSLIISLYPALHMADVEANGDLALKKLYKRIVDGAQLRSTIFSLYNDQSTADVTLDAGGRRWCLHGCILSAWSHTWRDQYHKGHRAFRIADADADIVDELIRYLYSGELTLTSNNASTLLSLAQALRIGAFSCLELRAVRL